LKSVSGWGGKRAKKRERGRDKAEDERTRREISEFVDQKRRHDGK